MKLNLGAGKDYRKGYVNVDDGSSNDCKVDLKWDLNQFPWPFKDNSADEILMVQVLEHLPHRQQTLSEIKRILKVGGKLVGSVPYARSHCAMVHWQHYNYYYDQTFYMIGEHYNFDVKASHGRLKSKDWKWRIRNWFIPGRLMEWLGLNNAFDVVEFELTKQT